MSAKDPILYDARSALDAIAVRAGFLPKNVGKIRNIWGEPVQRAPGAFGDNFASNYMSPIRQTSVVDDKAKQEVARLKMAIAKPKRTIRDVDLSADEYDFYQMKAGETAKILVDKIVSLPTYDTLPDDEQEKLIRQAISKGREVGAITTLREYKNLLTSLREKSKQ